jgi:hypothetical protein
MEISPKLTSGQHPSLGVVPVCPLLEEQFRIEANAGGRSCGLRRRRSIITNSVCFKPKRRDTRRRSAQPFVKNTNFGSHLLTLEPQRADLVLHSFTYGNNCQQAFEQK